MTHFLRWVVILNFVLLLNGWKSDRRPKKFGDSIPSTDLNPHHNKKVQTKIVLLHNYFRSRVKPSASNMLKLKWHKGAASAASRWARKCQLLNHDSAKGRYIDEYGSCGQNIFIGTHKVLWYFAIKTWYLEKHNFTYGSDENDLNLVGHYTQMIWASTHEIGCGFAKCYMPSKTNKTGITYYSYVCNYCPIGNKPNRIGLPYKKGPKCSDCKGHCSGKRARLCTNSCPYADLWSNCDELKQGWSKWLCGDSERKKSCRATCDPKCKKTNYNW